MLLGSGRVKVVRRTLMKLSQDDATKVRIQKGQIKWPNKIRISMRLSD
jgi:hypothetical protein